MIQINGNKAFRFISFQRITTVTVLHDICFLYCLIQGDDISGYEDSIVMHITRMLASNQYEIVIQSAK